MTDLSFLDGGGVSRVIGFDTVGGTYFQKVKLTWGADGAQSPVSAANPLPVDTEITTYDHDTGAGTDNKGALGVLLAASGGGVLLPGDATNGAKVQVATAPPVSRTGDAIGATLAVDKLLNNLVAVTPQFALISASGSGDNAIVAAAGASNKILVHQLVLIPSAGVSVKFRSATTDITGLMPLVTSSGFVLPFSPVGWFTTAANVALNLNLSGATPVGGALVYTVVQ